jgi:hypothetical protein
MTWVFWTVMAISAIVFITKYFKPFLNWRWTKTQTNLGIDYSKLPIDHKTTFAATICNANINSTTSENELVVHLFMIYVERAIPPEALVHTFMLATTIDYITAKLQVNPAMQELGDIYLCSLLLAMNAKLDSINDENEKSELFRFCKYLNEYLIKHNIKYRTAAIDSLSKFSV